MTTVNTSSVGAAAPQMSGADGAGMGQRVPPQSIQAEACVLGSMVLHSPAIDAIIQITRADHFYRPAHQMIFQLLIEMRDAKKPIDLVSVRNELERRRQLDQVGGIEYLVALVEGVPTAANAEYYATIVRDKALLRKLIVVGTEIVQEAFDTREEAPDVIDSAEMRIFEIASDHIGEEASNMESLLKHTFETLEANEGELITGLASGYQKLDELTSGFQKGDVIIVAARPSMGKTSILLNMASYIAVTDGVPVAFYSLEMSKEQVAQRLLASHARFDLRKMRRGAINPEDWTHLQAAAGDLQPAPLFIDDTAMLTLLQLRAKSRRLQATHGIRAVFVDYIQLMTYHGRSNSRWEQITEISRGIKALAKELGVPVIVAAQLNRGPADRPSHRPRMSDLRESGSLEQDADVIMLLHNEDYFHRGEPDWVPKDTTELIVAKQRNGPTDNVYLRFLPEYTRFEAAAPDSYAPI
ncbi:MAG TPA: replicative DNA helicase [Phycisphaerae bacterium]|nr:replicative DNA helicase [Phycisphaerae bacterium]